MSCEFSLSEPAILTNLQTLKIEALRKLFDMFCYRSCCPTSEEDDLQLTTCSTHLKEQSFKRPIKLTPFSGFCKPSFSSVAATTLI